VQKDRRINCSGKQWIGGLPVPVPEPVPVPVPAQCPSPTVEGAVYFWLAPFPILKYFSLRSFSEDGGRQTVILILSVMKTAISVLHRHCDLCTTGTIGAMHGLSGHTAPSGSEVMDVYCTAAFRHYAPGGCPSTGPDHCDPKFSYFSFLILSVITLRILQMQTTFSLHLCMSSFAV